MKILGIGKNYVNDLSEIEGVKTGLQVLFSKPTSSLVTDNKDVVFPSCTNDLRYEVELLIKIAKTGKDIKEEDALGYIESIAVGIDYTAKDILDQYRAVKGPWDMAKGFDGAAPISDFIPASHFENLEKIAFDLKINGETKQVGDSTLMIYNFKEIISYISKFMTLEPGDLIFTGTPASGAGQIFKGDHLEASIEGKKLLDFKMV